MKEKLLYRVEKTLSLPGLGVLLLPAAAVPDLEPLALHTALRLHLRHPGGPPQAVVGSVEEIAQPGQPARRALLLAEPPATPPPPGTEVWGTGAEVSWEELL